MIEHVHDDEGRLLALIVSNRYDKPGISFFTGGDLSQQLGYMRHPAGTIIKAHVHNPVRREVHYTQETLFIKRGTLRVDFYNQRQTYLQSRVLGAGDVMLLIEGGHGFEVLEELEMFEVKQGPYAGDQDKTLFSGNPSPALTSPPPLLTMSDDVFQRYSAYYDLLYRDKDYAAEAAYIGQTLRAASPRLRSVLELGSGTGKHGRLLAALGLEVFGVERSAHMVEQARRAVAQTGVAGSFACTMGDARTVALGRTFDSVISLFHVVSYQTTNEEVLQTFATAHKHVEEGGFFFFDCWHGPAVLRERPVVRVKRVEDESTRLTRIAEPVLDSNACTVTVNYTVIAEGKQSGHVETFGESHHMRYFFPTEISLIAAQVGFTRRKSEEFLTRCPPSEHTWGGRVPDAKDSLIAWPAASYRSTNRCSTAMRRNTSPSALRRAGFLPKARLSSGLKSISPPASAASMVSPSATALWRWRWLLRPLGSGQGMRLSCPRSRSSPAPPP